MPFLACQNSKYFRFDGILNFSRNRLKMPCFFLYFSFQPIVPTIFENYLIELPQ